MDYDYDYTESMEYEYTHPQAYSEVNRLKKPNTSYMPPSPGTFQIPESFFNTHYNTPSLISDSICNTFDRFKLDEKVEQKESEKVSNIPEPSIPEPLESKVNEQTMSRKVTNNYSKKDLVLFSPIVSPKKEEAPLSSNLGLGPPVDQTDIPLQAPITSTFTPTSANHHHAYHNYFPPIPAPIDESRNKVYVFERLFKIIFTTIIFCAIMYICSHVVTSIKKETTEKILKLESGMLDAQILCRRQFTDNNCISSARVPAVVEMCQAWESCMFEPIVVGRAKILGETVGEMMNGFFEKLSIQSKLVLVLLSFGTLWAFKAIVVSRLD